MKTLIATLAAMAALTAILSPSVGSAAPGHHRHKVCSVHHHHKVCHWA